MEFKKNLNDKIFREIELKSSASNEDEKIQNLVKEYS